MKATGEMNPSDPVPIPSYDLTGLAQQFATQFRASAMQN